MAELDWRPVFLFFTIAVVALLWLVGCTMILNEQPRTRSAATAYPPVTLTVGRLVNPIIPSSTPPPVMTTANPPNPTGSPGFRESPSPGESPHPDIVQLELPSPRCFETNTHITRCIGRVDNPYPSPISGVSVEVRLRSRGGRVIHTVTAVDQALIPVGMFAPYRVDFNTRLREIIGVTAQVNSGEIDDRPAFASLPVANITISAARRMRIIRAEITPQAGVLPTRAVISLLDAQDHIVGYQVHFFTPEEAASRSTIFLEASVLTDADQADLRAVIHAEGRVE